MLNIFLWKKSFCFELLFDKRFSCNFEDVCNTSSLLRKNDSIIKKKNTETFREKQDKKTLCFVASCAYVQKPLDYHLFVGKHFFYFTASIFLPGNSWKHNQCNQIKSMKI